MRRKTGPNGESWVEGVGFWSDVGIWAFIPQDDKVWGVAVIVGESATLPGLKRLRDLTARWLARAILLDIETCRVLTTMGQERQTRRQISKFLDELWVVTGSLQRGYKKGSKVTELGSVIFGGGTVFTHGQKRKVLKMVGSGMMWNWMLSMWNEGFQKKDEAELERILVPKNSPKQFHNHASIQHEGKLLWHLRTGSQSSR